MPVPGLSTKSDFERMFDPEELGRWGDRWLHRYRASQQMRLRLSLDALRRTIGALAQQPAKLLDIGCGQSDFLLMTKDAFPHFRFYGMDISENAIAWNRLRHPEIEYRQASLLDLPYPPGSFDVVCALEVLYYLGRDQQAEAIRTLAGALRPGGILLLTGVLDGGRRYFDERTVEDQVAQYFTIERKEFNYARLYSWFERGPRFALETTLAIERILSGPQEEFRTRTSTLSRKQLSLVSFLRWPLFRNGTLLAFRAVSRMAAAILRWKWPVRWGFRLTKTLLGRRGRSHLILVLKKPTGANPS